MSHVASSLLAVALMVLSAVTAVAAAQEGYVVERVETTGDVVRAFVSADLAPVEALVRANATEAARRASPGLLADRSIGTHRFRDIALDVTHVRFSRGATNHDVRIEVNANITADRDYRTAGWNGLLPALRWVHEGRRRLATGVLVVRVAVGISQGRAVVLRILGEHFTISEPIATHVDLAGRTLHTHVQPILDHPSIAGLTPEAAALRGIDGDRLRFVVRFRRL